MSLRKIGFFILSFVLVFSSCKKDDDGGDTVTIVIRERGEQQDTDDALLLEYLSTHYYNSSELGAANLDAGIQDVVITKLAENETIPDGHTLLETAVGSSKTVVFADTNYEYYVLNINQGGGSESPSFADTVQILYEGSLLDATVFDSKFFPDENPIDLTGVISGWRKVIPNFNEAESFVTNDDGVLNYYNSGLGVMFLPSGLAYFSGAPTGIPSYSPLVFKFELLRTGENDHDGDGIPSYLEDLYKEDGTLGSDGEFTVNFEDLTDENDDDTDGDGTPDYADSDDDGDGVLTIDEDINGDGDPTNDIGVNGIANYLDPEETTSKE